MDVLECQTIYKKRRDSILKSVNGDPNPAKKPKRISFSNNLMCQEVNADGSKRIFTESVKADYSNDSTKYFNESIDLDTESSFDRTQIFSSDEMETSSVQDSNLSVEMATSSQLLSFKSNESNSSSLTLQDHGKTMVGSKSELSKLTSSEMLAPNNTTFIGNGSLTDGNSSLKLIDDISLQTNNSTNLSIDSLNFKDGKTLIEIDQNLSSSMSSEQSVSTVINDLQNSGTLKLIDDISIHSNVSSVLSTNSIALQEGKTLLEVDEEISPSHISEESTSTLVNDSRLSSPLQLINDKSFLTNTSTVSSANSLALKEGKTLVEIVADSFNSVSTRRTSITLTPHDYLLNSSMPLNVIGDLSIKSFISSTSSMNSLCFQDGKTILDIDGDLSESRNSSLSPSISILDKLSDDSTLRLIDEKLNDNCSTPTSEISLDDGKTVDSVVSHGITDDSLPNDVSGLMSTKRRCSNVSSYVLTGETFMNTQKNEELLQGEVSSNIDTSYLSLEDGKTMVDIEANFSNSISSENHSAVNSLNFSDISNSTELRYDSTETFLGSEKDQSSFYSESVVNTDSADTRDSPNKANVNRLNANETYESFSKSQEKIIMRFFGGGVIVEIRYASTLNSNLDKINSLDWYFSAGDETPLLIMTESGNTLSINTESEHKKILGILDFFLNHEFFKLRSLLTKESYIFSTSSLFNLVKSILGRGKVLITELACLWKKFDGKLITAQNGLFKCAFTITGLKKKLIMVLLIDLKSYPNSKAICEFLSHKEDTLLYTTVTSNLKEYCENVLYEANPATYLRRVVKAAQDYISDYKENHKVGIKCACRYSTKLCGILNSSLPQDYSSSKVLDQLSESPIDYLLKKMGDKNPFGPKKFKELLTHAWQLACSDELKK